MLTKCPECLLQVSDKAISCPHCGYPLKPIKNMSRSRTTNKRRRLPNGFGQISEIKNRNLRNPFRAMVTVSKNHDGKPICKPLKPQSYFATYNDAYAALVEYNKNPYDLEPSIKVKELYERWYKEHTKTYTSNSNMRAIEKAWEYCSSLYNMRVIDIRSRHIKDCMENGTIIVKGQKKKTTPIIQAKIKSLFNLMLDYALEYELIDRNYSRSFKISSEMAKEIKKTNRDHISFTDEEISLLWENVDRKEYVDIILIQCYSGWRPQELGLIELENVDIENWTFKGGIKTASGKDRLVPIHSKIKPLVKHRYDEAKQLGSKYLINYIKPTFKNMSNTKLTYDRYQKQFRTIMGELKLNPEHRPHDGRKHFVTMAKKYGVDEYAIKYIVGHYVSDITEKIYTDRDFEWIRQEIEKIK